MEDKNVMNYLKRLISFFVFLLVSCNLSAGSYQVVNVRADDVLNVRSEATSKSAVVGVLTYDANDIELTGMRAQKGRTFWVEIKYKKVTGWVNSGYLLEQKTLESNVSTAGLSASSFSVKSVGALTCNGSEPDWFLSFDEKKNVIEFESLAVEKLQFSTHGVKASKNNTDRWFMNAEAVKGNEKINISLVETHQCSDDMSDFVYRYSVTVNMIQNGVYSGCCNREVQGHKK